MQKRIFIFLPLILIIFVSFFVGGFFVFATNPSVNSDSNFSAGSTCNGGNDICSTATLVVASGDTIVVSYSQTGVLLGSTIEQNFVRINDSQHNSITQAVTSYYSNQYSYGETIIFSTTASASGTDTITLTTINGVEATTAFDVINVGSSTFTTGASYAGAVSNMPLGLDFVAYAGGYSGNNCAGPTVLSGTSTQSVCSGGNAFGFVTGYIADSTNSTVSILSSGNQRQAMSVLNIGQGNSGCNVYACSTSTYSTSIVNEYCLTNPMVCTNETTSTTWTYDATSSVITYTTCSVVGNGSQYCVTMTKSISATETFTDTSASLTTVTVSTTTTFTAVVAPSYSSLNYWFFGFVVLIIPAATITGIGTQRDKDFIHSGEFIPSLLLGFIVGSLLGLVLNVLPWEFLVVFLGIFAVYLFRNRL